MRLLSISIKNCKSLEESELKLDDYTLLVGENNSGKSNVVTALRILTGDIKPCDSDRSFWTTDDCESYVDSEVELGPGLAKELGEGYVPGATCKIRRVIYSKKPGIKPGRLYVISDKEDYKEIKANHLPEVIFIPALSNTNDHLKLSGPSTLRSIISLAFESSGESNSVLSEMRRSIDKINEELRNEGGVLKDVKDSLNASLSEWGIKAQFSAKQIDTSDIIKSMIDISFIEDSAESKEIPLESFGHGFQRSAVYNLINLSAEYSHLNSVSSTRSRLLLFEEPEAYLHPNQQVSLSKSLQKLGSGGDFQVIVTSHSPNFVKKSSHSLTSIARIHKNDGKSTIYQMKPASLEDLLSQQADINMIVENNKIDPEDYTDNFSYHIWLDGERSSLFFADRVLIVEGATERILLNYLFDNDWQDFNSHKLYVFDALGKYNILRYMKMLEIFGIPHGVIYDGDEHLTSPKKVSESTALRQLIESKRNSLTLSIPIAVPKCTEIFLGLEEPKRANRKPLEILRAAQAGTIEKNSLSAFRGLIEKALEVND